MRRLFIFRNSYDATYILSSLWKKNITGAVILESGKTARRKKLKRMFNTTKLHLYPILLLDLISLIIYSFVIELMIKKKLGKYKYPSEKKMTRVNDANEKKSVEFIKSYKPDIIYIYGTAILGKKFLKQVNVPILNIHTGIVPYYRNVHSDFWAYINNDFDNIGVSIIYVDSGIDTGDLCIQENVKVSKKDTLTTVKVKNLRLIIKMIETTNQMYKKKKLLRKKQKKINSKSSYRSPKIVDIAKLMHKQRK